MVNALQIAALCGTAHIADADLRGSGGRGPPKAGDAGRDGGRGKADDEKADDEKADYNAPAGEDNEVYASGRPAKTFLVKVQRDKGGPRRLPGDAVRRGGPGGRRAGGARVRDGL